MITGKYCHSLDAKNRIIIPSKVKEQLGEKFTIVPGSDRCLKLYSEEEWEKYDLLLREIGQTEYSKLTRYLYSNALEVQPDTQGRVMLPAEMLEFAGITRNVITVGCGRYAEVWAKETWDEQGIGSAPENLTELLIKLGL